MGDQESNPIPQPAVCLLFRDRSPGRIRGEDAPNRIRSGIFITEKLYSSEFTAWLPGSIANRNRALASPGVPSMAACIRNVYIDAGANWCNTLQLHDAFPRAAEMSRSSGSSSQSNEHRAIPHPAVGWLVYAFEASPIIASHAEACTRALNVGSPLPSAPVPMTGNSGYLWAAGPTYNCTSNTEERYRCILSKVDPELKRLRADPDLASPHLLTSRMAAAATACPASSQSRVYTLMPAAVGAHDGNVTLVGSRESLLHGGLMAPGASRVATAAARSMRLDRHSVPVVDIIDWLRRSFRRSDFVLLKLDVRIHGRHIRLI